MKRAISSFTCASGFSPTLKYGIDFVEARRLDFFQHLGDPPA
jgi:hypothetical protein